MRTSRLLLVPAAVTLAAGLAGPAYAGHGVQRDAAKDVVSLDDHQAAVPTDRDADITRLDTTYTHKSLTLKLSLRAVPDKDDVQLFGIVTQKKPVYAVESLWTGHGTTHRLDIRRFKSVKSNGDGTEVTCSGAHERRTAKAVVVTIPATCLDKPRYVRTFAFATYMDDGDQTGATGHVSNKIPHFGPKVRP